MPISPLLAQNSKQKYTFLTISYIWNKRKYFILGGLDLQKNETKNQWKGRIYLLIREKKNDDQFEGRILLIPLFYGLRWFFAPIIGWYSPNHNFSTMFQLTTVGNYKTGCILNITNIYLPPLELCWKLPSDTDKTCYHQFEMLFLKINQ